MDWNISKEENINALLIVAHPDDETIFCGGTILNFPLWKWEIRVLTFPYDSGHPDYIYSQKRHKQLINAIEKYKQFGVSKITQKSLRFLDSDKKVDQYTESELAKIDFEIKNSLGEFSPNIVFTHNSQGEYGKEQHKVLNKIVSNSYKNIWEFICPGAININPQPFKSKENKVALSQEILDKKTEIFDQCYISELYNWNGDLKPVMQYEFKVGPEIFTFG